MPENERLFLSTQEALDAVNIAFSQYSSQFYLIEGLWPLVFGRDAYVMRDSKRPHFWAKTSKRSKLLSAGENDLKQWIVSHLQQSPPSLEQLAKFAAWFLERRFALHSSHRQQMGLTAFGSRRTWRILNAFSAGIVVEP